MNTKKSRIKIEDFLLDDGFVEMVRLNDRAGLKFLMEEFPDSRQEMEDAILIVRRMKIEEVDVPTYEQTKNQLEKFNRRIRNRSLKVRFIRVVAAAAIVIIGMAGIYRYTKSNKSIDHVRESMFSLLDSMDISTGEIRLIAGDYQMEVNETDDILQNKQGETVVGGQKIEKELTETVEYLQLIVPYGKHSKLKLDDGTVMYINSGTAVLYPKQFSKGNREIFVDGEVFLEVARDEAHPFIVHAKKLDVTVLGTRFNISSYRGEAVASVVLVEGSVEVTSGNGKNKLEPNQAYILENDLSEIKTVNVYPHICWIDGYMQIDNESLETILGKLARYYNVRFNYDRVATTDETFAGKLDLSEALDDVLHSISFSTPFSFEREGSTITIIKQNTNPLIPVEPMEKGK
jgi:hypothetical protein